MIGSVGAPTTYTEPGPRDLVANNLGMGTIGAGDVSVAAGSAGSDVVGVIFQSEQRGAVTATVANGRFALWFPGDELIDTSTGVKVEVTYRDGTSGTALLSL